ncbi:helicase HerA-like domain-containing protein [Hellea balneolensis]|uniref:helicase HerA-like domain-containing protein n=1 Tax=Hellea balneolensis TaxID=287478 RepID=UPI000422F2A5|nr:helicase HerA-like domain-containing protein [Hellea balneolensis]
MSNSIFVGTDTDGKQQELLFKLANRHGLIAGATGTGKTVTLQILTEGFSKAGIPVFAADVKGDLSGLSQAGSEDHKLHDKLVARAQKIGLIGNDYAGMLGSGYEYEAMPAIFWDLYGKQGHPVRTTIMEMGPTLLARLMDLNETQEGILTIAFELAEDEEMLLLDMKDLNAVLNHMSENKEEVSREYGNVTSQSVAAIRRSLLKLKRAGAEEFFGEPALKLSDLMRVDKKTGKGMVSILAADELINSPDLYSTFLLWLLSELFEELPEVGNPDKPKMVFFFDEAHLLFDDAPKALVEKIEQVARLIRSKGVGIYFVTQNPMDIPDSVLGQLGNRIQHALRAYTPKEQKAIRAAASSFRENPNLDTEEVITDLGVGEALVSLLDEKGVPGIVGRTLIRPPASRLGPATKTERKAVMSHSPVGDIYDTMIDRESAYEMLFEKTEKIKEEAKKSKEADAKTVKKKTAPRKKKASTSSRRSSGRRQKTATDHIMHEVKLVGRQLLRSQGRKIIRGILGGMMRR